MMKRKMGTKLNIVGPPLLKRMKPCIQDASSSIFGSPRSNRLLETIIHKMLRTAVVNTLSSLIIPSLEESTTFWHDAKYINHKFKFALSELVLLSSRILNHELHLKSFLQGKIFLRQHLSDV